MRNPIRNNIMLNGQPLYRAEASYYGNYLNRNRELLDRTLEAWGRVLVIRFDLRFPDDFPIEAAHDNALFTSFIKDYRAILDRRNIEMEYVVRREQITSVVPHYHAAILLNGNKAQNGYFYQEQAQTTWIKRLTPYSATAHIGLVHYGRTHLINRYGSSDTQHQYDEACKMLSYFAKYDDRDITPSQQRKVFYSQCRNQG